MVAACTETLERTQQLQEVNAAVVQLKEQLQAAKDAYQKVVARDNSSELKELQETNMALQMEIDHQQLVLASLHEEKKNMTTDARAHEQTINTLHEQELATQAQLQLIMAEKEALEAKIKDIKASAVEQITETINQMQQMDIVLEKKSIDIKDKDEQVQVLTQQIADMQAAATNDQANENIVADLQTQLEQATTQLQTYAQEAQTAKKETTQLKKVAKQHISQFQYRVQDLEAQITEMDGVLEAKSNEIQAKDKQLADAQSAAANQQVEHGIVAELQEELRATVHALDAQKQENETARRRIAKLEDSKLTAKHLQHIMKIKNAKKRLSAKNKQLKAALAAMKSSGGSTQADSTEEVQQLRAMLREHQAKLRKHVEYAHKLEENEVELKALLNEAKAAAVSAPPSSVLEELKEMQYKVEKYSRKLSKRELQLTKICNEVKSMKANNQSLIEENKALLTQSNLVTRAQDQLLAQTEELDRAKGDSREGEKEILQLRQQVKHLEDTNANLCQENLELMTELDANHAKTGEDSFVLPNPTRLKAELMACASKSDPFKSPAPRRGAMSAFETEIFQDNNTTISPALPTPITASRSTRKMLGSLPLNNTPSNTPGPCLKTKPVDLSAIKPATTEIDNGATNVVTTEAVVDPEEESANPECATQ